MKQTDSALTGMNGDRNEHEGNNVVPTLAKSTAMELVDKLESLRREKPSMEMSPLRMDLAEVIGSRFGLQPSECDYAAFGNIIDRAKSALDESLPLGQYFRSSLAIYLLATAAQGLRLWMGLKGFDSELINLDRTTSREFQQDEVKGTDELSPGGGPIAMDRATFAPNGKLVPAVHTKVTDIEEPGSRGPEDYTKLITVTQSRSWTVGTEGNNVMRVQRSRYLLGEADPDYRFGCPLMASQPVTILDQRQEVAPAVQVQTPAQTPAPADADGGALENGPRLKRLF